MMWDRVTLKNRAKASLKGTYFYALIVSFIMFITSGAHSGNGNGNGNASKEAVGAGKYTVEFSGDQLSSMMAGPKAFIERIGMPSVISIVLGIVLFVVMMLVVKLLVGYLIEVGGQRYFLQASQGDASLNHLMFGFSSGRWMNIVRTMFLKSLFIFLWSLLLLIPGIIKYYSYRLVPYILAENPEIDSLGAIELSKEMTSGQKLEMFFMDLSFIGWFILGSLLFGIGVVLVMPYYNATYAELYYTLKGTNEISYEG